ncbi:MAG: hypothetical protein RL637_272 [Pseudomonadota bacterium]
MLNFKNLGLRRGYLLLFKQANLTIHQQQKVGITGANGTGKSSLFALLREELTADEGELSMPPQLAIAHVAQETPALNCSAMDYVIDGDKPLRELQHQLKQAEFNHQGLKVAELHAQLDLIGGYTAEARAGRLLTGLGFNHHQHSQPVSNFSGGWRMRLNLAQALMCRSELLLLDEPTNHLDLEAVIWLQEWLNKYQGTLLLISHDRDFLDDITTHIIHIEQQKLTLYTGNYSAFERMRAEKLAQQQSAFEKQQREIAHIQSFINRFKAQATKAKQAQSRIKSLERMELIAQAHVDSPFHFTFAKPTKIPNPLLQLEQIDIGYSNTVIVRNINLTITPGNRIGLLGQNGAGKSSVMKVLANELIPIKGKMLFADQINIGYFAQHQLEQLHLNQSPLWHCQQLDRQATEKELRHFLGGFDFCGDKVLEPIAPFSGGEKARLVLALLVYQNPNLLLLDEPTNHLDLEMREALILALQNYQGAMIVVSHDRHLLRSVTDQFLLVADQKLIEFDGDLEDYRNWLADQKKNAEPKIDEINDNIELSRKQQRKQQADRRLRLKPLLDAVKNAESALELYHQQQQQLEQQLADPNIYLDTEKSHLKQLLEQKNRIDEALIQAETDWLIAQEHLEAAE